MKFGRVRIDDAAGTILGHSVSAGRLRFKKGRILSRDDISILNQAGITEVMSARLEASDISEDIAAKQIGQALARANVRAAEAFTGRCNLYSQVHGIVQFAPQEIHRINAIDQSITIATLAPYQLVGPGQMIATIKIIPFSVSEAALQSCLAVIEEGRQIHVLDFKPVDAGLILTSGGGLKTSVLDKTADAVRTRLATLGGSLHQEIRCAHDEVAVAEAIRPLLDAKLSPIFIFGASAIVDRRDIIPAAIEAAGGTIDRFGMPVDPGNLLLLAHHGGTPIVGVPGCARSLRLNGFDWVLQRLMAGMTLTGTDIAAMGVGGLLSEIVTRPQPRERIALPATNQVAPRIAALVLAAGMSRRMKGANKLLGDVAGTPMIARTVAAVLSSHVSKVYVVTGHSSNEVRTALADKPVTFVENPDYAAGISTTIRRGVSAILQDNGAVDGVLVCLGDMPGITAHHLDRLIAAYNPVENRSICVPTFQGKHGNPVLWGAQFLPRFTELSGDVGAKHLIAEHEDAVCEVAMTDDAILTDIDTQEALETFAGKAASDS